MGRSKPQKSARKEVVASPVKATEQCCNHTFKFQIKCSDASELENAIKELDSGNMTENMKRIQTEIILSDLYHATNPEGRRAHDFDNVLRQRLTLVLDEKPDFFFQLKQLVKNIDTTTSQSEKVPFLKALMEFVQTKVSKNNQIGHEERLRKYSPFYLERSNFWKQQSGGYAQVYGEAYDSIWPFLKDWDHILQFFAILFESKDDSADWKFLEICTLIYALIVKTTLNEQIRGN